MRIRTLLTSLIIALSFMAEVPCIGRDATVQPVRFHHIGKESGLTQISVLAIFQDQLGRMWFGTEEGLNVYDGVSMRPFTSFSYPDVKGLVVGNNIGGITGGADGDIYFTADNALFRYDLRTQQYSRLIANDVNALFSSGGDLYVGVGNAVYHINTATGAKRLVCTFSSKRLHATAFCTDYKHRLYVGTNDGLYIVPMKGGKPQYVVGEGTVSGLYLDSRHDVWVSMRSSGLYMIAQDGNRTHFMAQVGGNGLASNQVRGIAEDLSGDIWIGTFLGLNRYDRRTGTFSVYTNSHLPNSLSHNSVFPLYRDLQGTLWVGTYFGGVDYFNNRRDIFTYYPYDPLGTKGLSYPYVGHITEDDSDNLWIATEGGGLNCLDRKTKRFAHYRMNSRGTSVPQNNVKDILLDRRKNRLLIATHTGGISFLDLRTKQFHNVHLLNQQLRAQTGDRIVCLNQQGDDLIFSSEKGIWTMDLRSEQARRLFGDKSDYGNTYFMADKKRRLWIAGNDGLWCVPMDGAKSKKRFYASDTHGLGHFPIICMTETRSGRLYFGTRGSGVFRYDETTDGFTAYTTRSCGMAGDYCYAIAETPKGDLLVSSDNGLTLLNPDKGDCLTMELGAQLPLSGFNVGCGIYVCKDGEIFVGGTDGMVSFREERLSGRIPTYSLYWNDLTVNNKAVLPMDSTGLLRQSVSYTDEIELAYDQNDIILDFAANNYIPLLHRPIYEYRLEGINKRWTRTRDHRVHYTNISPGRYTLILRDAGDHTRSLRMAIHVRPPLWATPWAYTLYIIIMASIVYAIFRFKQSQLLLKTSLAMERREKEHMEKLSKDKLRFFTSISHEFRTPLTLILSQVDILLSSKETRPSLKASLAKLHKNAIQLGELINEVLDFRKLEQGYVELKMQNTDLAAFLQGIFSSFKDIAEQRGMRYTFTAKPEMIPCRMDPEQMKKVVNNLLSNAFKYAKSEITLSAESVGGDVFIRVADDGIGIAPKDIEKIFERFYQVDDDDGVARHSPSSGIGLHIVKTIVELHHGEVRAESKQGYGSVFVVRLPNSYDGKAEIESVPTVAIDSAKTGADAIMESCDQTTEKPDATVGMPQYTILLVEDNEELLKILSMLFSQNCRVLTAIDGQDGLEKVREEMPDLVLSDIMMPRMSGTDLCTAIKSDPIVCHIPVVLLTALGTEEQMIKGLKLGADDYISKPFNNAVLLARCNSIVANRRLLQRRVRKSDTNDDIKLLATNDTDRKLLDDVGAIIEQNLNNSDFNVDDILRQLAMSRTAFYAKFKSLTGMSPNDYIMNYKLKRAAELLQGCADIQIKDITYRLGFGSPRYFSHCFKTQFGISPNEWKKRAREDA